MGPTEWTCLTNIVQGIPHYLLLHQYLALLTINAMNNLEYKILYSICETFGSPPTIAWKGFIESLQYWTIKINIHDNPSTVAQNLMEELMILILILDSHGGISSQSDSQVPTLHLQILEI